MNGACTLAWNTARECARSKRVPDLTREYPDVTCGPGLSSPGYCPTTDWWRGAREFRQRESTRRRDGRVREKIVSKWERKREREKHDGQCTKRRAEFQVKLRGPLIDEKMAPWKSPVGETPVPQDAITKGVITTWGTHNQEECGSGNCIRAVVRVRLYKQKPLICFWSGFNFLMK